MKHSPLLSPLLFTFLGCSNPTEPASPEDVDPPLPTATAAPEPEPHMRIVGNQSQANPMVTGQSQPRAGLQVNLSDPSGKPESGTMTLEFAVQPPSPLPPFFGFYSAEAIISWGISSNRVTRRISVINGGTITGVGEAVTVQLVDTTVFPHVMVPVSLGAAYGIDVQVGLGVRGSVAQLPTLQQAVSQGLGIAPASSVNVAIPDNSGVIAVQVLVESDQVPPVAPDVRVSFHNALAFLYAFDPTIQTGFVAVAPTATLITIANKDPANPISASVIWGIDG